jgi:hypothetical protein
MLNQARQFKVVVVGSDGVVASHPMKKWLRENPGHCPPGTNPTDSTSHQLRDGLKKLGWCVEELSGEVRLYAPGLGPPAGPLSPEGAVQPLPPTQPGSNPGLQVGTYPPWGDDTPNTNPNAIVSRRRSVQKVRAIWVKNASYRSATFTDIFELADQNRTDPIEMTPSGKRRVEVVCAWHGVKPPNTYPQLALMDGCYTILDGYTGEVADNIGRKESEPLPASPKPPVLGESPSPLPAPPVSPVPPPNPAKPPISRLERVELILKIVALAVGIITGMVALIWGSR